MPKAVKTRAYNSPRRQEQAAATRAAILDAAARLFAERGYAATTVAAIAAEAGVATKTVHLAFETKGGIVRAWWNRSLRGDDEDAPVAQREWYLEALEEPDPARQLRLVARYSCAVKLRIAEVLRVIREGAATDPDVAALWDRVQREFHANQSAIVDRLAAKRALRKGLDAARAADLLWTYNHPDVWQLLVRERGWTPEEYEDWLATTTREALLR